MREGCDQWSLVVSTYSRLLPFWRDGNGVFCCFCFRRIWRRGSGRQKGIVACTREGVNLRDRSDRCAVSGDRWSHDLTVRDRQCSVGVMRPKTRLTDCRELKDRWGVGRNKQRVSRMGVKIRVAASQVISLLHIHPPSPPRPHTAAPCKRPYHVAFIWASRAAGSCRAEQKP